MTRHQLLPSHQAYAYCIYNVAFAVLGTFASWYRQIADTYVVVVEKISYLAKSDKRYFLR